MAGKHSSVICVPAPRRLGGGPGADSGYQRQGQAEPIIDIHQHVGYTGRTDQALIAHQRAMGATTTILLPAGRSVSTASTHDGVSNGLQAQCLGNEACFQLARAHAQAFTFVTLNVLVSASALWLRLNGDRVTGHGLGGWLSMTL